MASEAAASTEGKPAFGVTVGKFFPLHVGHQHLLRTASASVDKLCVLVGHRPGQQLAGDTIAGWVREMVPTADVVTVTDDLPEAPRPWAELTLRTLRELGLPPPDVAITGEAYGPSWAAELGCPHMFIPRTEAESKHGTDRSELCGTFIRQRLGKVPWDLLSPPARAQLCRRVVVVGAESTGTTTLAQALAVHYQTCWVPEHGRTYFEGRQHTAVGADACWDDEEFVAIATGQTRLEDALARRANRVLFCDTDASTTIQWHRRYTDHRPCPGDLTRLVDERQGLYSLYLLTEPDFTFVQDGTRESEAERFDMTEWFATALAERGCAYLRVSGSPDKRLAAAVAAVDPLLVWAPLVLPDVPQQDGTQNAVDDTPPAVPAAPTPADPPAPPCAGDLGG